MNNRGFWEDLNSPIIGLSPMDGVTDAPFRYMVAKYGGPSVIFTEFVSVDGMKHGGERVFYPFIYDEIERPVVAQVFGNDPELFYQAAVVIGALGFDGMDINMGCPAKKVEARGAGAGLIRDETTALEIIRKSRQGIDDWVEGRVRLDDVDVTREARTWVKARVRVGLKRVIPVSVKTRTGVDSNVSRWWMDVLMEERPAMISLHGRTLKQLYQGMADWEAIGEAAEVVHKRSGHILGNGDVLSVGEAKARIKEYGVDGVLIGRGAQGNPGVFAGSEPDTGTIIRWIMEHAKKYEETFPGDKFIPIRKHLAWYARGFPGASEVRGDLVRSNGVGDVMRAVSGIV